MEKFFIDLGSSTIKTHSHQNEALNLVAENSIYFKNNFSEEHGVSTENKEEMFNYFNSIKEQYGLNDSNCDIYATGIFRNLNEDLKVSLKQEFKDKTSLSFNIIDHEKEAYYLEKAMEGDYNNKKVLVINMGGKTTELVTIENNKPTKTQVINVGVAELLNKFPNVNDKYSSATIQEIVDYTKGIIEDVELDTDYDCAIFTGGELRFEKLTKYNLEKNTLFEDANHPYMLSFDSFIKGNNRIFFDLSMEELYELMPHNPKWMDGARPGAVLPQAIFEKANIKVVIPSDLNLINGVINDMKLTVN